MKGRLFYPSVKGFPWLKWYPGDYLRDTRILTLAAKGAWIDILMTLDDSVTPGELTLTVEAWSRVIGAPTDETGRVLYELGSTKVAEVVTLANGLVTVACRRMLREENARSQTRQRVARHRVKSEETKEQTQELQLSNGACNADETQKKRGRYQISDIRYQKYIHTGDEKTSDNPHGKSDELLRAERLFRRRSTTPLDRSTQKAWEGSRGAIEATPEEDWLLLEWFYGLPYEGTYRRKDLATLMNNWTSEIDRAREKKSAMKGANGNNGHAARIPENLRGVSP